MYFKYPSKSSLNASSPALSRIIISHQIDNYRRKLSIGRIKVQRQLQNKCQVRIAKNKTRQKMTVASLCTCTWLRVCSVEGWGIRCLCVFAVATTKTINAHTNNKNNKKQQQKRNVTNRATSTAHWLRTSEMARGAAQGSANGAAKRPKRMSAAREHAHERAHSWERESERKDSQRESKRRGSAACWGSAERAGNETASAKGKSLQSTESERENLAERERARERRAHYVTNWNWLHEESARERFVIVVSTHTHCESNTHSHGAAACANFAGKRWQRRQLQQRRRPPTSHGVSKRAGSFCFCCNTLKLVLFFLSFLVANKFIVKSVM